MTRSEIDLEPHLLAAAEVGDAGRLAEGRVALRRDEVVQAAVARPVESVEELADEADRNVAEGADVLFQAEIDRAVREAPGGRRTNRALERMCRLACRKAEALREVEDVGRAAGAERE